jgi:hypothetical protein
VALAAGAAAAAGERCSVSRGHQQRLAAVNGVTGSAAGDIDRHMSGSSDSGPSTVNRQLPPDADRARVEGNTALFDQQYSTAIRSFTRAICLAPWSAGLYNQRATALLKRGWKGDAALALLDCDAAVLLAEKGSQPGEQCWNPGAARGARLKRIDAFQALKQYRVRQQGRRAGGRVCVPGSGNSSCALQPLCLLGCWSLVISATPTAGVQCCATLAPAASCTALMLFACHKEAPAVVAVLLTPSAAAVFSWRCDARFPCSSTYD